MATPVRPDPVHWVLYAFGAGLPGRHRSWVLHDVTTRTWLLRHFARSLVQIAPFAVVIYFLVPGEPAIRVTAVLMGAALGLFYAAMFAEPMAEHRAIKAGYPEGTAESVRKARH